MDRHMALKVFCSVARLGSFSAAAKELDISRAMASKYIGFLENQLGVRLLNRTTRQLSITEAGSAYYERVNAALAELDEADMFVTELQTEPMGVLKVLAPPSFGSFHIARALHGYKKRYPRVILELILSDGMPDLIEEGMDMAIQLGEPENTSAVARNLTSSRLIVCASPEYFSEHGMPQFPEQLHQYNCMKLIKDLSFSVWKFNIDGKEISIDIQGNLRSNISDTLRIAAINHCGIVQLPSYMVGLDIKSGRLQRILENYEPAAMPIYAIYAHRKHLSAKVRTFVDYLQGYFKTPPYWEDWMEQ